MSENNKEYQEMVNQRKSEPVQARVTYSPGLDDEELAERNAKFQELQEKWAKQAKSRNELRSSFSDNSK